MYQIVIEREGDTVVKLPPSKSLTSLRQYAIEILGENENLVSDAELEVSTDRVVLDNEHGDMLVISIKETNHE